MGTIQVKGTDYSDITVAFAAGSNPADGVYYALPPLGNAPTESALEYEEMEVTFPGVDDIGLKRLGRRGRQVEITLIIVGADKAAIETVWAALVTSLTALARYTIVLPGGQTRQGCKLVRGGGAISAWSTLGSKQCAIVPLTFRQYSQTN